MAFGAAAFVAVIATGGDAIVTSFLGRTGTVPVYDTTAGFTSDAIFDGRLQRAGGAAKPGLNYLYMANAAGTALAALNDFTAPVIAANTDAGIFTTAGTTANLVSLPSNFGCGRGNWTAAELLKVRAQFAFTNQVSAASVAASVGGPAIINITLNGADIEIWVKQFAEIALASFGMHISYVHSTQN